MGSMERTIDYGRLPLDLRAEHDRVMALAPVEYRGYLIKPCSHAHQPYQIGSKAVYWGFNVIYANGPYKGCNAGPGATWAQTVGGAKTIIDCMHEAGAEPLYRDMVGQPRDETEKHLAARRAWADRFWALMRERQE